MRTGGKKRKTKTKKSIMTSPRIGSKQAEKARAVIKLTCKGTLKQRYTGAPLSSFGAVMFRVKLDISKGLLVHANKSLTLLFFSSSKYNTYCLCVVTVFMIKLTFL